MNALMELPNVMKTLIASIYLVDLNASVEMDLLGMDLTVTVSRV